MPDEKQKLAEAKRRLEVIRLAVKLGDEELLFKLGASAETIQSVRRLRAAEAEKQKDYKSLPPEARAKVKRKRSGNWSVPSFGLSTTEISVPVLLVHASKLSKQNRTGRELLLSRRLSL